jgi:stearoyl-CoA desaturase (delta-9 desaturase)
MTQTTLPSVPVSKLKKPEATEPTKVYWLYAVPIVAIHILALLAVLPWLFSWSGLIAMVVGVFVYGQAINLCYHRVLAHKSAKLPKWFEHFWVIMALCCMEDTPARWVSTHRCHHNDSDTHDDPHSPLVTFFWGHCGWLMLLNRDSRSLETYQKYAPDILQDPFYLKIERSLLVLWVYLAHAAAYFLLGLAIGWVSSGIAMTGVQFGLSLLVWGVLVRTVAVWHITWSVNSLTHLFGYQSYKTGDESRNNWIVALFAVGEGWHNNHHHDPASASNQHRWWEIDITYYNIKLMELVGLARDVTPQRHRRRAAQPKRAAQREASSDQ